MINRAVGCHYSARPVVTIPASEHHCTGSEQGWVNVSLLAVLLLVMQQMLMDVMRRLLSCREHRCVILSKWKFATNIRLLTSCCSFICLFLLVRRYRAEFFYQTAFTTVSLINQQTFATFLALTVFLDSVD